VAPDAILHIKLSGHWLSDVQVALHCGTGVGVGVGLWEGVGDGVGVGDPVGVDVTKLNVSAQAAPPAFGLLDGALGATEVFLSW